ncbi:MAG: hypothetical protein ACJ76P_04880 [Actinomycetota bacterium]
MRRSLILLLVPALLLAVAGPALAAISVTPEHPTFGTTSWGTNGRVWAMVRIGDIVYMGGEFTEAVRADGGANAARGNLMAVNVVTGYLRPWHPAVDGIVFSMATDGTTIFVGGDFTNVDGLPRENFAAIGPTGAIPNWHLDATNQVRALTYSGTTLFMGGQFGFVEGQRRTRLAAADLSAAPPAGGSPALLDWTPKTNKSVRSILVLPDGNILIGGVWTEIREQGGAAWDTTKPYIQALTPPGVGGGLFAQWDTHPIDLLWKLALTPDGSVIAGRGGNQGGSLSLYNSVGDVIWNRHANGDVQSVGYEDGEIVAGGHWTDIAGGPSGVIHLPRLVAVDPATGTIDTSWEPWPNATKGVWSILTGPDRLLIGGDFTTMDHGAVNVPHYAQFAITP